MHWYVYPLAAFAIVFLGHFLVDQVGQPIRSVLRLRRLALERITLFRNAALPMPRELATTSQAIHEHDRAVRNLRRALVTFHDLGAPAACDRRKRAVRSPPDEPSRFQRRPGGPCAYRAFAGPAP